MSQLPGPPRRIAKGSTVYRTYTYDRFSRRTQQTASTSTGQVVTTYSYENDDDLSQILHNYPGATADLTLRYMYSPAGELINSYTSESLNRHVVSGSNGTQSYTAANDLNQYPSLTPIGGSLTSISYDANGNLTSDGVNTFGYDAENRFLSVSGGATATYAYDALDRRMTKTTGGATTRYLHAGSDEIAEYTSSGTLLRRFVPGPGTDERAVWIESASTSPPATALSYPHTDRLGSVLSVTSNTGTVSARYEYNGWGGSNSSTAGYPFRYTGQRLDPETGLMFYKARIYSMSLGRFLQTDPIGTKDDLNLYAYTGNDPVNKTDPTGRNDGYPYGPRVGMCSDPACGAEATSEYYRGVAANRDLVMDFTPVVSDIKGAYEFYHDPTPLGGVAVGVGLFPVVGDWLSRFIKGISHGHHAIPKFLGGDTYTQELVTLSRKDHVDFHNELYDSLKEAGGFPRRGTSTSDWAAYMTANPGEQRRAFDILLQTSREFDQRNTTAITQSIWKNVMEGNYTSYP